MRLSALAALISALIFTGTPAPAQQPDRMCADAFEAMESNDDEAVVTALEACLATEALDPQQEVMVYAELASALGRLDRPEDALRAFSFAFAIADTQNAEITHPMIYRNRGIAYAAISDFDRALADLRRARREQPDDALLLTNLGYVYGQLERHAEAVEAFDQLIRVAPDWSGSWLNRSSAFLDLDMYARAVSDARRAVELEPDSGSALNMLCWTLIQDGRAETALPICEQAVATEPETGSIVHSLATALEATGDTRRAYRLFAEAHALAPDDPEITTDYERTRNGNGHRP
ncbi:tetratricopeptide repeat protein [Maricaulis sp.]|uniref:tetratricopeptide repeat protein n=1 Tax=Maricaulis sp. TaxID=1486257 RepID=UPI00260869D5|nr:tetratricopeptide repeat protein [Maricaulis sp.]